MEYESIKNNFRIIGKFPGIKLISGAPSEILDSYDEDDLPSDDECNSKIL